MSPKKNNAFRRYFRFRYIALLPLVGSVIWCVFFDPFTMIVVSTSPWGYSAIFVSGTGIGAEPSVDLYLKDGRGVQKIGLVSAIDEGIYPSIYWSKDMTLLCFQYGHVAPRYGVWDFKMNRSVGITRALKLIGQRGGLGELLMTDGHLEDSRSALRREIAELQAANVDKWAF